MARLNSSMLDLASCFLKRSSSPLLMASSTSATARRLRLSAAGVGVALGSGDWAGRAAWLTLLGKSPSEPATGGIRSSDSRNAGLRITSIFRQSLAKPYHGYKNEKPLCSCEHSGGNRQRYGS